MSRTDSSAARLGSLSRNVNMNNINSLDDSWGYDVGMDGDADDSESVMTDLLSPGGQTDAQTLACMLQVRPGREVRLFCHKPRDSEGGKFILPRDSKVGKAILPKTPGL